MHEGQVIDTLSRQREWQKEQRARLNQLIELDAPQILIDEQKKIVDMTLFEYAGYCRELEEEDRRLRLEYVNTHPIQKEIVDKIYEEAEKLPKGIDSYYIFLDELNVYEIMSKDDFNYGLYDDFLRHAWELNG